MKKKFTILLHINNALLILFYFLCADMPLAPLWGLTWFLFLAASAAELLTALTMKRMTRRLALNGILYGVCTALTLVVTFYAMMQRLFLVRAALCAAAALLALLRRRASAFFADADEKYRRQTDALTREALAAYLMSVVYGGGRAQGEGRVRVAVLNVISVLLSGLLLLLGAWFHQSILFYALSAVTGIAFVCLSRKKYAAAEAAKRWAADTGLALSSAVLLALYRCLFAGSVNFFVIVVSIMLMCPYWMTAHDLLCRYQLGWKLAE